MVDCMSKGLPISTQRVQQHACGDTHVSEGSRLWDTIRKPALGQVDVEQNKGERVKHLIVFESSDVNVIDEALV